MIIMNAIIITICISFLLFSLLLSLLSLMESFDYTKLSWSENRISLEWKINIMQVYIQSKLPWCISSMRLNCIYSVAVGWIGNVIILYIILSKKKKKKSF